VREVCARSFRAENPEGECIKATLTTRKRSRQEHNRPKEGKYSIDRNTKETERKEEDPNNRIQNQRQQGERPAENKKYEPQQKFRHRDLPPFNIYVAAEFRFHFPEPAIP
jgi:hypothetical protein